MISGHSHSTIQIEDYEQYIGAEAVERIVTKAKPLRDRHIAHINSTYYGGGVAELLGSMVLLFNGLGIKTGWRIIQGSPDFFSITKNMHNALQGETINLSDRKKELFEALREAGYGDLVYETVNANSLSAFVKEQTTENGDALPAWLDGLVNVFEKTTVGVRKAAR